MRTGMAPPHLRVRAIEMDIASTRDNASPTATTAELAQFIQASPETILRYKRMEDEGPFREHRDYIYLGLGRRKLLMGPPGRSTIAVVVQAW